MRLKVWFKSILLIRYDKKTRAESVAERILDIRMPNLLVRLVMFAVLDLRA
jgi:hypothetical protein